MRLPVSPALILIELQGARAILDKWIEEVETGNIPAVQQPGAEAHLLEWLTELTGELTVVAGKCDTLARTLAEPPGS
jgi:hypothetical protein